jgi:branched-chain amino acid transport system permease protein
MSQTSVLVDILVLGAAYSLVAVGFVLVLNATGAVNFSHGELVMAGGFASVALAHWLAIPGIAVLPVLFSLMAVLGALIALVAYLPLKRQPPESVFISTIAVGIIIQSATTLLCGPEPRSAPSLLGQGAIRIGAGSISVQGLAIVCVSGLTIAALYVMLAKSQLGRRLRAVAQDQEMAAASGIWVDAVIVATFALAAGLAGIAGLMLSNSYFVSPSDGAGYILKVYIAVAIGGWGSISGAVAGALLVATVEVLYPALPLFFPPLDRIAGSDSIFSQTSSTLVLDAVVLLILSVRPQGLFGRIDSRPA